MGDSDVKIDFGVPASLRKWPSLKNERVPKSWGGVPYFVADGTLDECIRDFMSKPTSQHHLYEIHTAPQGASERGSVGRAYCRIGSAAGFSLGAALRCSGISAQRKHRNAFRTLAFLSVVFATEDRMKIAKHPESHIVKLDDGSTGQTFADDIDQTLAWLPTTELRLFEINDEVASHALISCDDGTRVRTRPHGEKWPVGRVKDVLKQG